MAQSFSAMQDSSQRQLTLGDSRRYRWRKALPDVPSGILNGSDGMRKHAMWRWFFLSIPALIRLDRTWNHMDIYRWEQRACSTLHAKMPSEDLLGDQNVAHGARTLSSSRMALGIPVTRPPGGFVRPLLRPRPFASPIEALNGEVVVW